MNDLKNTPHQTLKKHLDRMDETAEFLSHLAAGEAKSGHLHLSHECARLCVGQLSIRDALMKAAELVRGSDSSQD